MGIKLYVTHFLWPLQVSFRTARHRHRTEAELRKIKTFEGKNIIYNEQPVEYRPYRLKTVFGGVKQVT